MQKKVNFTTKDGFNLSGVIHFPEHRVTQAYALFAHCFTCTKNINSAVNIANALADEGIATLRFDFTGLGASKGDFADTSFTTNVNDLIDAAEFLGQEYEAPQIIVGHSLGGTAILAAAKNIPSAKAVATLGSPASPEHVLHHLESELETLKQEGQATVHLAGRPFTFKQCFVDDVHNHKMDYRSLGKALMVMHSPIDDTVSISEAETIYKSALHPKSFITLDKADHLISKTEDSMYAGHVLASWARRYIDLKEKTEIPEAKDNVVVAAQTSEGFLNHVNANGHEFLADEPERLGGTNLGPTPYDYLSTALGTCTAMTLNMYARRKKLEVSKVIVNVSHDKVHAEDCDHCKDKTAKVDQFARTISIEGDITPEQRQRLLEIADLCPVHKTLHSESIIKTKLQ
ncbi:bifunctional alpha/beta hydrolase/OsmC family protein [Kangiella geojedonensis]|uniref:Osmotically inducible protein C n=1 Tax=Kangiella geojedonensis TaxID=914150 RepID=A0A0F6RCT8_9GAMM|nr:bifunctional alpha/beta hydrolase/OsmC family protein [Kangiella geojedonensis]AKE52718.1 osmotically inducible protein C [Kangiella geojedonensis]